MQTDSVDVLKPIPWYKSQSLVGIATSLFGFAMFAASNAPAIAQLFPDYAAEITYYAGAFLTIVGLYNGASGRVTTTRPIAGTEAAKKVVNKVAAVKRGAS